MCAHRVGGAGGRQNSVGESLFRGQSAAGPKARGARCPSAAGQSSVFIPHIALVDWAVDRNLRRSYCSVAIALSLRSLRSPLSALRSAGLTVLFRSAPDAHFTAATHLGTPRSAAPGAGPAHPLGRPHLTDPNLGPGGDPTHRIKCGQKIGPGLFVLAPHSPSDRSSPVRR